MLAAFGGAGLALAETGWDDCREGRVNCLYPGHCHDYTDTNDDGICDHSQAAPADTEDAATATTAVAAVTSTPEDDGTAGQTGADATTAEAATGDTATDDAAGSRGYVYYLIPLVAGTVALYAASYLLMARGVIRLVVHRRIWNAVLLATFIVSAVLGFLPVINIDLGTNISPPFSMTFWHVETGIVMGVVAALHIGWHWRYFQKLLKPAG